MREIRSQGKNTSLVFQKYSFWEVVDPVVADPIAQYDDERERERERETEDTIWPRPRLLPTS